MNAAECSIIQRLVNDLDNTRVTYTNLAVLLRRPYLKFLVEQIAESHVAIAADLARHVKTSGGVTMRRDGHRWIKVRAWFETWVAAANADIELGCLERIARHESDVTAHFQTVLEDVKGLPTNFSHQLCGLVRGVLRLEWLMRAMERTAVDAVREQTARVISRSTHKRDAPEAPRSIRGHGINHPPGWKRHGVKATDDYLGIIEGKTQYSNELYYGLTLVGTSMRTKRSDVGEMED